MPRGGPRVGPVPVVGRLPEPHQPAPGRRRAVAVFRRAKQPSPPGSASPRAPSATVSRAAQPSETTVGTPLAAASTTTSPSVSYQRDGNTSARAPRSIRRDGAGVCQPVISTSGKSRASSSRNSPSPTNTARTPASARRFRKQPRPLLRHQPAHEDERRVRRHVRRAEVGAVDGIAHDGRRGAPRGRCGRRMSVANSDTPMKCASAARAGGPPVFLQHRAADAPELLRVAAAVAVGKRGNSPTSGRRRQISCCGINVEPTVRAGHEKIVQRHDDGEAPRERRREHRGRERLHPQVRVDDRARRVARAQQAFSARARPGRFHAPRTSARSRFGSRTISSWPRQTTSSPGTLPNAGSVGADRTEERHSDPLPGKLDGAADRHDTRAAVLRGEIVEDDDFRGRPVGAAHGAVGRLSSMASLRLNRPTARQRSR